MNNDFSPPTDMIAAAPGTMPAVARWLGLAGLVPQVLLAAALLADPAKFGPSPAGVALVYSATILSFIGGSWWGLASRSTAKAHRAQWIAAVIPSLVAFAAGAAWAVGVPVGPLLCVTSAALIATLAVDRQLVGAGIAPPSWLGLRMPLSLGLGGLTFLIAIVSQRPPG